MKKIITGILLVCMIFCTCALSACGSFFGTDDLFIEDISYQELDDGSIEVTISYLDNVQEDLVFVIPKGDTGTSVEKFEPVYDEDDPSLVIGANVYLDDGSDPTFVPIPKGSDGKDGKEIIEVTTAFDETLGFDVFVFVFNDESTFVSTIQVPQGDPGVGITEIKYLDENGNSLLDENGNLLVTILLSDETSYQIAIPKGDTGAGIRNIVTADVYEDATYKKRITIFYTDDREETVIDMPIANQWYCSGGTPGSTLGRINDYYFDSDTSTIYLKTGEKDWTPLATIDNQELEYNINFCLNSPADAVATLNGSAEDVVYRGFKRGTYFWQNEGYTSIPVPSCDGYTFMGWFLEKQPTVNCAQFTDLTPIFSELTLYAKWERA